MNKERLSSQGESYYQKVITFVALDMDSTRKEAAAIVKRSVLRKMLELYPDTTLKENPKCWATEILSLEGYYDTL